jgi:signal peptidase I
VIPKFVTILAVALAAALAWWRPFRVAVEGSSMRPTLEDGDWLAATRRGRIRRGSLVVVRHPERQGYEMVKRVTGVPGDVRGGRVVGAEEFWIEGDDLARSTDSRSFGPIQREHVAGVIRIRYRRVARSRR